MYRLIVIDDEYIVVEGIKAMIGRQKLDYEVVGWAYDGIHGLDIIGKYKPDLVITDIRIPGMGGLSMIEAAKEVCPDTAFVVISGYTEFEYAQKALRLGVMGYIDKPISMEKLNAVLETVEKNCFQAKRKKNEYEENRRRQEKISQILEECIRGMLDEDIEKFYHCTKDIFAEVELLYPDEQELRREVYKYLCMLCDILQENRKDIPRNELVSFHEMEKCQGREQIKNYAQRIITDIGKYLEAEKTGSRHGTILELLAYIEQHYNEDIGLNELADMVQMSPAYLSVLFKSEVGMSYVKYLTNLRMNRAKEFLKEGRKVYEVSELVGYHNYRYFSDTFKKYVGQTPKAYTMQAWGGTDKEDKENP